MMTTPGEDQYENKFFYGRFPEGFAWGTATSAYQVEGAAREDGRGPSIWDTFVRQPGKIENGDTGDVACDSYHKIPEDINIMKELGTGYYRFSISWSRILPDGTPRSLNRKGVDYYNKLINALLDAKIVPMVTLYHWDLPQALEDQGGLPDPRLAEMFANYARVCYREFGDRVKLWITFNEPVSSVFEGYFVGEHAPGLQDPLLGFKAAHTIIRAHALAYSVYDREFRAAQKGQVGITLLSHWFEPMNPSNKRDVEAANRILQFMFGWYIQPIFGDGDYPRLLKDFLDEKTRELGLPESILPQFTDEEKRLNKGSYDFLGLNHYTTLLVRALNPGEETESVMGGFLNLSDEADPAWARSGSKWLIPAPFGMRRLLNWVKVTYGNPPVYITENGYSDRSDGLEDAPRVHYYKMYLNEVLKAIRLDGCDVRGYMAWSLMDNFEWYAGYAEKLGLYQVDFSDPKRPRRAKQSAKFYAKIIKDNGFVESPPEAKL